MAGDVSLGYIKRISYTPEGDKGNVIGGQNYWNVFFLGGAMANVALTNCTINGVSTATSVRVVTASGAVNALLTDGLIVVNKTSGEATTVNLPASPATGQTLWIKDGKGDAYINNITITPASGTVDGLSHYVLTSNYQAVTLIYNGTQWNVL
jgi:hypothetical protein